MSDRGTFDIVVMSQIEAEFQKCLASFTNELAHAEPAKKERAARVEAASSEHAEALATEEVAKAAKEATRMAQQDAETEHKALVKALQQGSSDMWIAKAGRNTAQDELKELNEGPLAAFMELCEFTEIPPPPPSIAAGQELATTADTPPEPAPIAAEQEPATAADAPPDAAPEDRGPAAAASVTSA